VGCDWMLLCGALVSRFSLGSFGPLFDIVASLTLGA
jgi:hypothetical protein